MMDNGPEPNTMTAMHPLAELLTSFAGWQRQRGCSPATLRRRSISIRQFARWMSPAHIGTATTLDAEEWLDTFASPRTRHAYHSDLAVFYRWAMRRDILRHDPMQLCDPVKVPKCLPRPVPADKVAALIAAAPTPHVARAIALAAYAGLRRSEISALTSDDIALHTSPAVLIVRNGKGGKDRIVPVHPALTATIGTRPTGRIVPLCPGTIGAHVAAHMRACGIDATIHQLRHTFGTEIVRVSNGNLVLGGQLMGHESPNTTRGYVGWAGGDAVAAVGLMFGAA